MKDYFERLVTDFGRGWNDYWFTPSTPHVLGLLRLLTGMLTLWMVGTYALDLVELFGDTGVMPLATVQQLTGARAGFSLLDYARTPGQLWAFFVLSMVVVVLFTVGLFSRITSILATIVFLSFVQRAPAVTSEVEPVLCMLLVYLCLGPSGATLSLDAWLHARRHPGGPRLADRATYTATLATRLIQVHITLIYVMMVLGKLVSDQWWNGMAVWWLLTRTESRWADFTWLSEPLINAWTHGIVLFELTFPWLVRMRNLRPLMLLASAVAWGTLPWITGLGEFAAAMFIAGLSFLTPGEYLAVAARFRRR